MRKMLKSAQKQRLTIEIVCPDMTVPADHLLQKIDKAVDFNRIYDIAGELYCKDNGRANSAGSECGYRISVIPGLRNESAAAALCDGQLCVPAPIYRGDHKSGLPPDTGRDRISRI